MDQKTNTITDSNNIEFMKAEMMRLKQENCALKRGEKLLEYQLENNGRISVHGLARGVFISLYPNQWDVLFNNANNIRNFIHEKKPYFRPKFSFPPPPPPPYSPISNTTSTHSNFETDDN